MPPALGDAWDPALMVAPLLTRAGSAVLLLSLLLVVAIVTLWWLAVMVTKQRRELADLRARLHRSGGGSRAKVAAGWAVRQVLDTPSRVRERGFFEGVLMAPIEELSRLAGEDRAAIEAISGDDGTVTVLFSDIEESTQLNEQLGDETFVRLLAEHDRVVRRQVVRHEGHVVKSSGDGFMVVFPTPRDAVAAALGLQRRAGSAGRRSRRTSVKVRIGINCGPVVSRDGDYFGRNVAIAARIAALAEGGQILMSDLVAQDVADMVDVERVGTFELRGLAGAHELYAADP
jgi:adenylate cyclase